MISGIAFVLFMAFLIKFSEERWWLWNFLVMGLAVKLGLCLDIIGIALWLGISKVLKDIFQAR